MLNSLLDKEFQKCLEKFPELKDVELMVEECEELAGAGGWRNGRRIIILFVPETLKEPKSLIPIIYHELSHMVSKGSEECEKIFYERADEQSKQLWKILKENINILHCEDFRK